VARLQRVLLCVIFCTNCLSAQELQPRSWFNAIFQTVCSLFRAEPEPIFVVTEPITVSAELAPPAVCAVAPLDAIEDADALKLEASTSSSIDIDNMKRAAAAALDRFQTNVAAAGGTIILKSAYRPAAYQKHLQNVWYKWMDELRNNDAPECETLRAQVEDEFNRHHLIETQHPVSVSDHTRGLAFDATVDLPSHARLGRRRVTVDTLARLSGLLRPAITADPVHFKFVGGSASRRKRSA
jgi:D-alanyl-D-alanine dipeptidase